MAGINWVGSPKALGARMDTMSVHTRASLDTVASKAKASVDSVHLQLREIGAKQDTMTHKIDILVVLACTRLTKDQRSVVQQVFTCTP